MQGERISYQLAIRTNCCTFIHTARNIHVYEKTQFEKVKNIDDIETEKERGASKTLRRLEGEYEGLGEKERKESGVLMKRESEKERRQ